MQQAVIHINELSCVRGDKVLFSGLNHTIKPSELIHITGANGTGKTSLLRLICGINEPDDGSIEWLDSDSQKNSTESISTLSYIGHKDGLKNELTAFENLRFYQELSSTMDYHKIDQALNTMGILHCAEQPTWQLSFGQRRRLAFARLLLKPYAVWVLDEPFTGIDTKGRSLIEDLCLFHLTNNGIILLTHHGELVNEKLREFVNEINLDKHADTLNQAPAPAQSLTQTQAQGDDQ